MRKSKIFSVSMTEKEVEEIDEYLKRVREAVGLKLSRNELVRKSTLAIIRSEMKSLENLKKEFKNVGCEEN